MEALRAELFASGVSELCANEAETCKIALLVADTSMLMLLSRVDAEDCWSAFVDIITTLSVPEEAIEREDRRLEGAKKLWGLLLDNILIG